MVGLIAGTLIPICLTASNVVHFVSGRSLTPEYVPPEALEVQFARASAVPDLQLQAASFNGPGQALH